MCEARWDKKGNGRPWQTGIAGTNQRHVNLKILFKETTKIDMSGSGQIPCMDDPFTALNPSGTSKFQSSSSQQMVIASHSHPGVICQCLKTFREGMWREATLLGRDQGSCSTSGNAQDEPLQQLSSPECGGVRTRRLELTYTHYYIQNR